MINTLRIVVLVAIVMLSIIRVTHMTKKTSELEAWAFIMIAVGCFWRLCIIAHYSEFLPFNDVVVSDETAALTAGIGILLVCINAVWGEYVAKRKDRRRGDAQAQGGYRRNVQDE